ncbi:N-acetyldiaminopimelate deacetylase [Lacticaseibacillus baoqingensis]|uniref:N-acetyldiaminopimelate deacetylase n=1 Tax=Lacticaseibacillus baoqingensis TaxID=2486013 RepID=A0ABW4E8T4_9LACO|nr:N-acetyldiaminopimelate deacetylase [Lacticaseibacillus baoqingensis]
MFNQADLIKIRRHLHQIPELALHETQTHAYLQQVVQSLPQTWLTIKQPAVLPTALLVKVHGTAAKRVIGYRADIDALPVTEATGLPFSSTHPGVAHACGHDMHMTVALGVLSYFAEHQPQDDLLFFFQPAEEAEYGGKRAYDAGVFTGDWHVDEFYGLHDRPDLPAGAIGCTNGTLFAGTTEINIDFIGQGGHAAFPQNANDAVVAAAYFVTQVQSIISRNVAPTDSAVITLGKLQAGTIRNVIADHARIEGTLRGFTQDAISFLQQRIRTVAQGVATSCGCQVEVALNQGGYYPVENDPALTAAFIAYMQAQPDVNFIETPGVMTGEDFGYLLNKIPGTMFWLGVNDDHELHSAQLSPDEAALSRGVKAITGFLAHRMQA